MSSKRDRSPVRNTVIPETLVLSRIFVFIPGVINWSKEIFVQLETETPLHAVMRICRDLNLCIPISSFYSSLNLTQTFKSQNIRVDSTIRFHVRCCTGQVYIQYPNGTDERYSYEKDLIDLQLQIEHRTGIPVNCQLLISMIGLPALITQETYEHLCKESIWYLYLKLYIINGNLDIHFPTQRQISEKGFVFDKTEFESYFS